MIKADEGEIAPESDFECEAVGDKPGPASPLGSVVFVGLRRGEFAERGGQGAIAVQDLDDPFAAPL